MNEVQVRRLLSAIQVDLSRYTYSGTPTRTRWLNIRCPFAPWRHAGGHDNNPSFGITLSDDRRSVYKCFSCNSKGRLAHLPSQLGHLRKRDYEKHRKWAELAELQDATSRPLPPWESHNAIEQLPDTIARSDRPRNVNEAGYPRALGLPYLRNRGIAWHTTILCDLRYDNWQRRILFPCYDRDESFVGFTGRSIRKGNDTTRGNDPKVKDYYGLPKRSIFLRIKGAGARRGPRILVEGLFDYARLVGFGYRNTHAILGTSSTPEKIDILVEDGDPVYFLMDNDLAGWQALFGTFDDDGRHETQNAWAYQLYREIPVWIVPYPAVFDGTDPGSLSAQQVSKMLSKAWLFTGKTPRGSAGQFLWR